jgi:hypothetical protein
MKEMNPGKIKHNPDPTGENGYPEKDVNKGVTHMKMKGAGAATKGTKFVSQINLQNNGKVRAGWS